MQWDSASAKEHIQDKPDGDVRIENLIIKVRRGATSLGKKTWGAISYLVTQRGYKMVRVKEL